MANEIVKYRNRLNKIPLRKFNTREMNIFFAIAAKCKEQGTQEITFPFSKIRKLSHFNQSQRGEHFVNELKKTYNKLIGLSAFVDDGVTIRAFVAFTKYDIHRDTRTVDIAVNPDFKGLFNDLVNNFTRFSLEEFARLKSTYSKTMFRFIKQFRTTGHLEFKMSDFKSLLDIPKSYQVSNIDNRILKPVKLELAPIFKNFAYKKIQDMKRGGKVIGYKFSWIPEDGNKNDFQDAKTHYQEQLENIDHSKFLKNKEKQVSKKLIKDYYYKNKKKFPGFVKQKEDASKIGVGKKLVKTSNNKARETLANFKKANKTKN